MYPKLQDLPEECIREVILRINDHHDLESASAAWTLMAALTSEQRVWRELTQFHFNKNQIGQMMKKQLQINCCYSEQANIAAEQINQNVNKVENGDNDECRIDWQKLYHALRR